MAKPPNRSGPRLSSEIAPDMRRAFQDVYDRLNSLFQEMAQLKTQMPSAGPIEQRVAALEVSLQAAQDALAQGTTFVGFGSNLPGAATASVQVTGSGVGFALSGPSNNITITVTNAATARAAIAAAVSTNVLGAPGTHTLPIPQLTGGGAAGSITFNNDGTITAFVDPT